MFIPHMFLQVLRLRKPILYPLMQNATTSPKSAVLVSMIFDLMGITLVSSIQLVFSLAESMRTINWDLVDCLAMTYKLCVAAERPGRALAVGRGAVELLLVGGFDMRQPFPEIIELLGTAAWDPI